MITSFYSDEELTSLGLKSYGSNVLISRKSSIYDPSNISIGNNVRIDDFCILSGKIQLGDYIHVSAYSALYGGKAGITVDSYANISSRVCVYAISDDYSGETMAGSMIPEKYKNIDRRPVKIGAHTIIGSNSVVLPGVNIADGGAFGCFSLIKKNTEPWTIYTGIPIRKMKQRSNQLLNLQKELEDTEK